MNMRLIDLLTGGAPQTETDRTARLVNYCNISVCFLLTTLKISVLDWRNLCNYSTNIYSFPLRNILYGWNVFKVKRLNCFRHSINYFNDLWVFLENYAEVILNSAKLLICQFDIAVGKQIHLVLLYNFVKFFSCVLKESSFYLCAKCICNYNF